LLDCDGVVGEEVRFRFVFLVWKEKKKEKELKNIFGNLF